MQTGPLTGEEIAELRTAFGRGDQTIGHCVLALRLVDEIEQSRAMLKRLEWSRISEATGNWEASCPICEGPYGRHELNCELALLTWPTSRDR